MKKQMSKKKRNQKLKKKLASMTALVLVLAVGVWGTLAYLSKYSNKKTNTFTGSAGLELTLREPGWGSTTANDENSKEYKPGSEIDKKPTLINGTLENNKNEETTTIKTNTKNYKEFVAMRVDFKGTVDADKNKRISYGQLLNVVKTINFDTTNWTLAAVATESNDNKLTWTDPATSTTTLTENNTAVSAIFVYKGKKTSSETGVVASGEETDPLFTRVTIKNGLTKNVTSTDGNTTTTTAEPIYAFNDSAEATALTGNFPQFKIEVLGAAVQANDTSTKDAYADLTTAKPKLLELLEAV